MSQHDLLPRLKKAIEFDEAKLKAFQDEQLNNPYLPDNIGNSDHPERVAERQRAYREGMSLRFAELRPILEELLNCVEALWYMQNVYTDWAMTSGAQTVEQAEARECRPYKALARLDKVVPK